MFLRYSTIVKLLPLTKLIEGSYINPTLAMPPVNSMKNTYRIATSRGLGRSGSAILPAWWRYEV